ncbi:uridylate kinase [Methylobacterium sp. SyP6R]|uniref:uridylate kinase n=1 Tax=Methylobacterium sp. SyP6R TaxID=2718876 RepID=UPI001F3D7422|nr:uridylate kinase [Methylobacterium sp. SyP6R]MCF4126152.1 uridylate kinase [Methylobacterium sp. SyP6R]
MDRSDVLGEIAGRIERRHLGHPVRVAVDGRTASGKTTLADELAALLRERGREVIRTSIDGFHRPRAERYARGRHSAEGYYHDARDLPAIVALLLAPLGPEGDRHYRTTSFDLDADRPIAQEPKIAAERAILIVDGTFLQRPELRLHWDATLFVRTSAETAQTRGLDRDATRLGGEAAARDLYAQRYRPAYALYEQIAEPEASCDVIVDNDDLACPQLHIRATGRLA